MRMQKICKLCFLCVLIIGLLTGCGNKETRGNDEIAVMAETVEATEIFIEATEAPTEAPTEAATEPTTEPAEEPTVPATEPEGVRGVVYNTSWVNVRTAPGVGNGLATRLARGTEVTVYETVTVDDALWGRIDEGWVSMSYIKLDGDAPAPAEEQKKKPSEEATEPTEKPTEPTEPEHVHSYKTKTVKPTCTADGYTTYSCSCGDSYKDNYVNSLGHKWDEWKTTKEPTETKTGLAERTCTNCAGKETKTLPKLIPNHTHKYTEKVTKEPTCTAQGTKTFTCSCGDTYKESVPKTGHKYSDKVTAPTCTEKGYTTHTCGKCGDSYRDSYKNAAGHSFSLSDSKSPTCTQDGYTKYACKACSETKIETISAKGHDYTCKEAKPTCTSDGKKVYTCSLCNDSYTETIPALGHKWSSWVTEKEPTESSAGLKSRTCSNCNKKETQTIDKLPPKPTEPSKCDHDYTVSSQTDATCTTAGSKTLKCKKCGAIKTEKIAAAGHKWGSWVTVKEPNESETGKAERTCSKCSAKESRVLDKLPPKPTEPAECRHNFQRVREVDPTCTKDGYYVVECTKCGAPGENQPSWQPARGHAWKRTGHKDPSCTEEGYNALACDRCGETKTESIPTSHNWVHHHEDEVGHWDGVLRCHCGGWSHSADGDYLASYQAHVDSVDPDDRYNHSYYEDAKWVVDVPAKDWDVCSKCGATK